MKRFTALAAGTLLVGLTAAGSAQAQLMESPFGFKARSGISNAMAMAQMKGNAVGGNGGAAGGGVTQLVCGQPGQSTSTANSTCIILNNATGDLTIGQDSVGDQSSENTESTDMAITQPANGGEELMSDALASLVGG